MQKTIKVLEQKIAKVEAAFLRACQERNQEAAGLKSSLNKKDHEFNNIKKELNGTA